MIRKPISIAVVMASVLTLQAVPAEASYRPIPERLYVAAQQEAMPPPKTLKKVAWVICKTWHRRGDRCRRVLSVSWCESRLNTGARGHHFGMFQFDKYNVKAYHPGRTAWSQSQAALDLWNDRHWAPWECRPARGE